MHIKLAIPCRSFKNVTKYELNNKQGLKIYFSVWGFITIFLKTPVFIFIFKNETIFELSTVLERSLHKLSVII